MRIYGTFKDRNDDTITVTIYNINNNSSDINIDTCDWIRFSGDEPVMVTTDCDDAFTHVIKKSCKINLLAKRWLGDYLFADDATSIVVNVIRTHNNVDTCLFAGYVSPNTYNQDYSHMWETITINCIDNLGVMQYRNQNDELSWEQLRAGSQMRTFKYLLDKMKLRDTTYVINNLPSTGNSPTIWVETGFERVTLDDGTIVYHMVETQAKTLDVDTAVATTNQRVDTEQLQVTYIQSEETTLYDGLLYYKKYAYVTVNGEQVNTGDWIIGGVATELMPTVVDTVNVLDGWTYGAHIIPFEYYEHFRIDNVMSDGAVKRGSNDTIGQQIPETPQTTTLGSYYEMRQADEDDLYEEEYNGTVSYYYKDYAWIIMEIDGVTQEYKTSDWVQGEPYVPAQQIQI